MKTMKNLNNKNVTQEVSSYIKLLDSEEFKVAFNRGILFENYAISNYGRVFSFNHKKILSERITKNGYVLARLSKSGKIHYIQVQRLVAIAFVKNDKPSEFDIVMMLDCNPSNMFWKNLMWVNRKINLNWGTTQVRRALKRSKPVKVFEATTREFVGVYESMPKAAQACNTTPSTVHAGCKTGKPRKGFLFQYVN